MHFVFLQLVLRIHIWILAVQTDNHTDGQFVVFHAVDKATTEGAV